MSQYLQRRISAVRAKHAAVSAGTGLTMAIAWFVGVLALSAAADWWFNFPLNVRAVLLLINLAGTLYFLLRYALLPLARRADDETLALAVEKMVPVFRTRLIAAIQFSRPGALAVGESGALVVAMVKQTEQLAATVDFLAVVRADRFARSAGIAAAFLLAAAGLYAYGGETSPILLQRAFLAQLALPQKTHVEVLNGSFQVAIGEKATLSARAVGWRPDAGSADITYASGRTLTLPLKRDPDHPDIYASSIDAVPESFQYRIHLYDGTSNRYNVTAQERPVVQSLACTQLYPAYTGLPDQPRQPTDLLLLAGSKLHISIQTNEPLQPSSSLSPTPPANVVHLQNQKDTSDLPPVPLQADPADPRHWTADLPLPENIAGFSIHLLDQYGLESKNPPFYPVDLLPDHPPTVRITAPDRREMLVTAEATTSIGFLAEDDFGLATLALHYKIDDEPEKTIPLSIHAGDRQVRGYYPWQVSKLTPPPDKPSLEGCVIEFYVEARDANDITGPGITASEHYQLRVVSKSDKQAELIARMAESFSTIHDVSDSQENAAAELGSLITDQLTPPPATTPAPPPANSQPNR